MNELEKSFQFLVLIYFLLVIAYSKNFIINGRGYAKRNHSTKYQVYVHNYKQNF